VSIAAGDHVGPYVILAPLGRGGMGEVYRAKDTRLGREVAVKVIREDGSGNLDSLARFRDETRAVASLNHPGILAIYDTGAHGGAPYAVMELLSGETLAERIQAGPLTEREASEVAGRVADALAAAHARSIVHRDVKPSNIFLTEDGQTKLLDFGIARVRTFAGGSDTSDTTRDATAGRLVGTAGYLSPEQVRGREADARSDVFALGATLYETLTGRRAFAGSSAAESLSAILTADPSQYPETSRLSGPLRRIVLRCLEKDPANRYQSARDLALDLHAWDEDAHDTHAPPTRPRASRAIGVAAAAVAALIAGIYLGSRRSTSPSATAAGPVTRVPLALSPPLSVMTDERPLFAVSDDGRFLVYVADVEGRTRLVLRDLESLEASVLPGTEGATGPFFSPDGRWIGFAGPDQLQKVSTSGGEPTRLRYISPVTRGAAWGPGDILLYSPTNTGGLIRLDASTGAELTLLRPDYDAREDAYRWPAFLPGGRAALFVVYSGGDSFDTASIAAVRLDEPGTKILIRGGTSPRYSPTGHLLYVRGGALMAAPFDAERLEIRGAAVPMLTGIRTEGTGAAQYALSSNGTLFYLPGSSPNRAQFRLVTVDREGRTQPLLDETAGYYGIRASPDGRRIAFTRGDANQDVWILDRDRGTVSRLTQEASEEFDPVWTPDGRRIAYTSERRAADLTAFPEIYERASDGTGEERHLRKGSNIAVPQDWTPDGARLVYAERGEGRGWDIWTLDVGTGKATPFLATAADEALADLSPDGRWIAYVSDETGRFEVYARPFPGPGAKILISSAGGLEPVWSQDESELFYRDGPRMMAVPVRLGSELVVGRPAVLFEKAGFYAPNVAENRQYDVAPDGKHFYMIQMPVGQISPPQPVLVANWLVELRRKVAPAH
jgi:serine/threonine-protein kinase